MASRRSVKKSKKIFVLKVVGGGVCVCIIAALVGFVSMSTHTPDQVSMGLGSSGTFQANISVSSEFASSSAKNTTTAQANASNSSSTASGVSTAQNTSDPTNTSNATQATGNGAQGQVNSSDVFSDTISQRTTLNELSPLNAQADLATLNNRIEQRKRAEEEARLAAERAHIQEVQETQQAWGGNSALETVDFSVGEEAFVQEWTERIDAYLAGSALAGYGCDFAQAAWDYGEDPRWSPAISNTESGKGSHCFLPYNAWGWGASIWFNWTDAIYGHVKGLADGYGYSITYAAASAYCPPNTDNWYNNTLGEMQKM